MGIPLFWLSLAFLGGIALSAGLKAPTAAWMGAAAFLSVSWLAVRHWPSLWPLRALSAKTRGAHQAIRRAIWLDNPLVSSGALLPPPIPLLAVFALLGAARYAGSRPEISPAFIAWYNDTGVVMDVVGLVVGPPDVRNTYTNLRVEVERLRPAGEIHHTEAEGAQLVRAPPGRGWAYGDRVVVRGQIETPPEEDSFSYRAYLANQGIYAYAPDAQVAIMARGLGNPIRRVLYALRFRAEREIYALFPDPEASLLSGILLGIETRIPDAVKEAFKDTGTSHIIAISGFNISILSALFAAGFSRLVGIRWGALAAGLAIAAYTVLVGADAAVVRAAIMGGLSLVARQVGRRQAGLNSLALTAALMALFDPNVPWDIGFQLSFGATLGLVLYAEPLSEAFFKQASKHVPPDLAHRLAGPIGEYFLFTLAAQLTTLPITLYHFQRLSLSSLVANPLILPVQPPVMLLGGLAVILGLVFRPLGQIAAYVAWPFVAFTIRMVEWVADIPSGVFNLGQTSLWVVALFYMVLFGWTFAGGRLKEVQRTAPPALSLIALSLLTVLTWRAAFAAPDGRLHLLFLDVGNGEAVLITTPGGRRVLVDGGPRASALSDALGRRLPLGARRLDYLVVASPLELAIGALPDNVPRFTPANVLWAGPPKASRAARRLGETLNTAGVPVVPAQAGQLLQLGDGAVLEVVAVSPRGAVLLLEMRDFRALLPVGLTFELLEALQNGADIGPVSVLLLAESGYAPLSPPEWIGALNPELVVISVGGRSFEELPSPETLAALKGYNVLRTDRHGWIEVTTDGERMWVEVERRGCR